MWIIVASLLLLGSIIYIAITLLGYTAHAASLTTQLEDLEHAIDHKTQRCEDYRIRAEELQETVPQFNKRVDRLKQWIAALKKQKAQLGSKPQQDGKSASDRDAAIRRGMAAVQKRKS